MTSKQKIKRQFEPNHPREKEIRELISHGYLDKEISEKLNISYMTVRFRRKLMREAYEKT